MTITINGSGTVTGASTLATTVASPTFTTPNINSATVSADATIASGDNGGSFGPTTINSGITLTVSSGSVYTVV